MTKYSSKQIEKIRRDVVGQKVVGLYYESDGDYFVMEFEDKDSWNSETAFRFMADLEERPEKA